MSSVIILESLGRFDNECLTSRPGYSPSTIIIICLLSSVTVATRGHQGLEIKVLPASVVGQCPSVEERERVRTKYCYVDLVWNSIAIEVCTMR